MNDIHSLSDGIFITYVCGGIIRVKSCIYFLYEADSMHKHGFLLVGKCGEILEKKNQMQINAIYSCSTSINSSFTKSLFRSHFFMPNIPLTLRFTVLKCCEGFTKWCTIFVRGSKLILYIFTCTLAKYIHGCALYNANATLFLHFSLIPMWMMIVHAEWLLLFGRIYL